MSVVRRIGFGLLGAVAGVVIGVGAGLLGGLGYTHLVGTSRFEGFAGYVVASWILVGGLVGLVAGAVVGIRLGR